MHILSTGGGYIGAHTPAERLGWRAKRGIDEMCRDAWRWQQNHSAS